MNSPTMRSQTARLWVQHSSSHQLPRTRLLCSWDNRKPALASSNPVALTLAYGLVFSSSHWPSSLPDMTAPHDLSQLPSGSAEGEKQNRNSLNTTGLLSQTHLHSWRTEQVFTYTYMDKLLKDHRVDSLLLWKSRAELHPASYVQMCWKFPSLTILLIGPCNRNVC